MATIQETVQAYLRALVARDLPSLVGLFAEHPDWDIPGDRERAPWLGKRGSREEIAAFYELLWQQTEPVSAAVDNMYFSDDSAVIAGSFSTKMLATGKVVDSPFFIQMTVQNGEILRYRLLEDSYAVSVAMRTADQ